jgi:predicted kinase
MNKRQPIAYIICGFIGAGKTTFARKLEKETGAIRITKDEWIIKIFGNKITSDKNFKSYDKKITELAKDIAFKILESGKDVIIDEGFWVKSQRDEIKNNIINVGAKPIFYYLECPIEKMKERVINRSNYPSIDSFEINKDLFDKYLKYWEPPIKEEGIRLIVDS